MVANCPVSSGEDASCCAMKMFKQHHPQPAQLVSNDSAVPGLPSRYLCPVTSNYLFLSKRPSVRSTWLSYPWIHNLQELWIRTEGHYWSIHSALRITSSITTSHYFFKSFDYFLCVLPAVYHLVSSYLRSPFSLHPTCSNPSSPLNQSNVALSCLEIPFTPLSLLDLGSSLTSH